jgi:hypothetical protein
VVNCINGPICGYPGRCAYGCHKVEPIKCIADRCPVAAGECDRDGECYLWACDPRQPNPNPESEAPQGAAGAPQSPAGRNPAAAPDHKDEVAEFADLMIRIQAARMAS